MEIDTGKIWLALQGDNELGGEKARLEFSGRQVRQIHAVGELFSDDFQYLSSFGGPREIYRT